MSSAVDNILTKAFALIENDEQDEALTILQPILKDNENNADVWWLYAHAVSDAGEAQKALDKVSAIDPTYPGATTLKLSLEKYYPGFAVSTSNIRPLTKLTSTPIIPDTLPDLPGGNIDSENISDDWDLGEWSDSSNTEGIDFEDIETLPSKKRPRLIVPLVVLAVIVLVIALVVVMGLGGTPEAKPMVTVAAQAQVPTKTRVPTMTPADTEEVPPQAQDDFTALRRALTDFEIPEDGIEIIETSLGNTLAITACEDRSSLAKIMDIGVREGSQTPADIEAVSVRIGDCTAESSMRMVGVRITDIAEYIEGDLTQQDFQRLWQPVE